MVVKKHLSNPDPLAKLAQHAFLSKREVFVLGDLVSTKKAKFAHKRIAWSCGKFSAYYGCLCHSYATKGHDFFCDDGYCKVSVSGEAIGIALKERQNAIIPQDRLHSRTYKGDGYLTFKFEQSFLSTVCQGGKKQKN